MSPAPPVEAERRARSPARVTFEGTRPPYRPPSPYQGPSFEPESTPQGREAVGYSTNRGDYRREQSPGPSEGYQRAPSPYPRNRAIEYSPRESSAGSGYRNQSNGYQSNRGRPFPAGGNVYSAGSNGGNWQPGDRGAENPGGSEEVATWDPEVLAAGTQGSEVSETEVVGDSSVSRTPNNNVKLQGMNKRKTPRENI